MALAIIALVWPKPAHAEGWSLISLSDITGKAIGWIIYLVGYVFISFLSVLIAVLAWILKGLMVLNQMIPDLAIVRVGYAVISQLMDPVIIVITIIVIFRLLVWGGKYGERNMYLSIFVAYLMIHYGLLITGWIPTMADRMAYYFLDKSMPTTGITALVPDSGTPEIMGKIAGQDKYFVDAIVGSLKPQSIFAVGANASSTGDTVAYLGGAGAVKGFASILQPLLGLIMGIILCLIIILAIFALDFMYIGRFFVLPLNFYIFPFVCIAFIFGSLRHHWYGWWSRHISWSIRPAIAILFLYLAITTSSKFNQYFGGWLNDPNNGLLYPDTNTLGFLGAIGKIIFAPMFQIIVVAGMIIGGLVVSFSLSLHLSDAAIAGAQTAAGAIIEKASSSNKGWLRRSLGNGNASSGGANPSRQLTTLRPLRGVGGVAKPGNTAAPLAATTPKVLSERDKIKQRITAAENLRDRATTPGERQAAEAAIGRLREKEASLSVSPKETPNSTNTAQVTKSEIIKPITKQIEARAEPVSMVAENNQNGSHSAAKSIEAAVRVSSDSTKQSGGPIPLSQLSQKPDTIAHTPGGESRQDPERTLAGVLFADNKNSTGLAATPKIQPRMQTPESVPGRPENQTNQIRTTPIPERPMVQQEGGEARKIGLSDVLMETMKAGVGEGEPLVRIGEKEPEQQSPLHIVEERLRVEKTAVEGQTNNSSSGASNNRTRQPILGSLRPISQEEERRVGRDALEEIMMAESGLTASAKPTGQPQTPKAQVIEMPRPTQQPQMRADQQNQKAA